MLYHVAQYALRRMMRSWLAHLLLIAVPLCVISVLGLVLRGTTNAQYGVPGLDWISVGLVISFQLFGGSYTIAYFKDDFFSPRRWRLAALPMDVGTYGISLLLASALTSVFQGLVLVLFTQWVYGVTWGPIGWVMLVLLVMSLQSQLASLVFTLSANSYKLAERLSEVYGIGSMVFAGMIFTLPDTPFFQFMSTYGNPVSLGMSAVFGMTDGSPAGRIALSVGLLLAAAAAFAAVALLLGRRRLT